MNYESGLTFFHGTVSSGKSVALIMAVHQYNKANIQTQKRAYVIKPALDTRTPNQVWSRFQNTSINVDLIVTQNQSIDFDISDIGAIFVDEVQFLSPEQIQDLFHLSFQKPVFCYGLKTTWKRTLFPGIATLLALADRVEEISRLCSQCSKTRALFNLRLRSKTQGGQEQNDIEIGDESLYVPVCRSCFTENDSLIPSAHPTEWFESPKVV